MKTGAGNCASAAPDESSDQGVTMNKLTLSAVAIAIGLGFAVLDSDAQRMKMNAGVWWRQAA